MTKDKIKQQNHQMMHVFTLLIAQFMLSIIGITLSFVQFNHNIYLYAGISGLNIMAMFLFQPFKIMHLLREGLAEQRFREAVTTKATTV